VVEWSKIKAEYIAGGTSYRKLAEKYGITLAVLRNVAEREEWVKLKAQAQHKTNTKMVESISTKEAKKAVDIIDVADKLLSKIATLADSVYDADSVKKLTSAIKDLKDIKGIKSEADIREQEARIAKLQKEAQEDSDTTKEIEVVFNAGEEAWNE
jgi:formyltetrahydrofolate synthetase